MKIAKGLESKVDSSAIAFLYRVGEGGWVNALCRAQHEVSLATQAEQALYDDLVSTVVAEALGPVARPINDGGDRSGCPVCTKRAIGRVQRGDAIRVEVVAAIPDHLGH